MYKSLVNMLMCPECKRELKLSTIKEENNEVIDGRLSCDNGHIWVIKEGVINFGSKEQELANNWSESYKTMNYKELDEEIIKNTPENLKEIYNNTKEFIINNINESKEAKIVLDIATGRGMLLTELAERLSIDAEIICADLSFDVLKYDRLKVKKINPRAKVNYIACDAARLPIKESSVDIAVSFFGIVNMLDKMPKGISEAARVLKKGKFMLNSGIVIKEGSQGHNIIKDWLNSQEIYDVQDLYIEKGFKKAHEDGGFRETNVITIAEDIGEKNDIDLLPFQHEWFAVVVGECKK